MTAQLTAWIEANPALAAMLAPLVFVAWSEVWHAIGSALDARGYPRVGAICHRLATRTPPTSKVGAVEALRRVTAEAADVAAVTPRNSGEP